MPQNSSSPTNTTTTTTQQQQSFDLERKRKPMLSTLFPNLLDTSSSSSLHEYYWWTSDINQVNLATRMQQSTLNGDESELIKLVTDENLHLPFHILHHSLLYSASLQAHLPIVTHLLTKHKHDINLGSHINPQCTPLHIALMRNHADIVFELLQNNARVTLQDIDNACQWGATKSLACLFLFNKLPILKAIELCEAYQHDDALVLLRRMNELTPLEYAAETMHVKALRMLAQRTTVLFAPIEVNRAMTLLAKSKLKLIRPTRDLRDCKEALISASKRVEEWKRVLIRFASVKLNGERVLLAVVAPGAFKTLFQFLNLIDM